MKYQPEYEALPIETSQDGSLDQGEVGEYKIVADGSSDGVEGYSEGELVPNEHKSQEELEKELNQKQAIEERIRLFQRRGAILTRSIKFEEAA